MQTRRLGDTDLFVSPMGLGTVKWGRNEGVRYPAPFNLPNDYHIESLLNTCTELGINLLDTAPAYGASEERLGHHLKKKRHQFVLSTKVGEAFVSGESHFDFSEQAIITSIERSLMRLQTDYIDIVLVHSNGDDLHLIQQQHVFEPLLTLKKSGKIRAFGMSTKTIAGGLLTVDQADVAMVTFNPVATSDREVIRYAEQQKKGILIKKALASGHLEQLSSESPVQAAMTFIFQEKGVNSVIVGTINAKHLQANAACIQVALGQTLSQV